MKKLVSIILALFTLLSLSVSVFALPFPDVSEKSWYYEDVKWVYDESKKLMSGYPAGDFRPNDPITRAEFVKVLHSLADSPEPYGSKTLPFTDIRENAWYTDGLVWAYKTGIINGKSNTRFAPNDPVTRAELATMIFRYVTEKQLKVEYVHSDTLAPDYEAIPDYAKLAAVFLYRSGLMQGKNGGNFDARANTTRAEIAVLLRRIKTLTEEQEYALLEKYGLGAWSSAWIDAMPKVTVNGTVLPLSEFWFVVVKFEKTEKHTSPVVPELSLKISKFWEQLDVETKYTSESGYYDFRVVDTDTLKAIDLHEGQFLIFEYTVTINGESETYMAYETVSIAW